MRGIVMGLALAMPVPAMAGAGQAATLRPLVQLRSAELRVGDLVEAPAGRMPPRIAAMVVARLPRGISAMDLPAGQVAALVRRRVPGLRPAFPGNTIVKVRGEAPPIENRVAAPCFAAAAGLAGGTALSRGDVLAVPCRTERPAPLRYESAGLVLTAAPVPAGGYLGRLAGLPERVVGKGASLTLRSKSGPVIIERDVVAMQPGRPGNGVFVRGTNGEVFAAPLALAEGARAE